MSVHETRTVYTTFVAVLPVALVRWGRVYLLFGAEAQAGIITLLGCESWTCDLVLSGGDLSLLWYDWGHLVAQVKDLGGSAVLRAFIGLSVLYRITVRNLNQHQIPPIFPHYLCLKILFYFDPTLAHFNTLIQRFLRWKVHIPFRLNASDRCTWRVP